MTSLLYLSGCYIRYHKRKLTILIAAITLVTWLPIALQSIVEQSAQHLLERAAQTPSGRASIPPSGVEVHGWVAPATAVAVGAQPLVPTGVSWAAKLLGRIRPSFPSSAKLGAGRVSTRRRHRAPGVVLADWAYLTEVASRHQTAAWSRLVVGTARDNHWSP